MFDRSQQRDRGGDREQIIGARQAAEALFAPKRQSFKQLDQQAIPPSGEPIRRPRVLAITPTVSGHPQEPGAPRPAKPKISKSQFARIRAWLQYGMTTEQVAEVYGVHVGEIARILRIAQ